MNQPWLRQVEVYIGPLQEWQGQGDRARAVKIVGDGTTSNLRVRFEIRKSIMSTASPSHIYLYNLGRASRESLQAGSQDAIQQKGALVELRVGWNNVKLQTIFSGTLYGVTATREGTDIVTTLISLAGYGGVSRSILSQTWAGGAKLSNIVRSMAGQIPGVTIGSIDITEYSLGNQGLSTVGLTKDALDTLARTYGFSWWIDRGVFYAVDDQKALQVGQAVISHKNGTLLRAEPMLSGPFQKQSGVTIRAVLNPSVNPGQTVKLESAVNPKLDGSYKVHSLTQAGDTHSSDWDMTIESLFQGAELAAGRNLP